MKKFLLPILLTGSLILTAFSASAADTLTTVNGIKYVSIRPGDGVHPASEQKVTFVYCRKSENGKIVESNELGKPITFKVDKNNFIPGLDEVVKHMSKGEKFYCIIPPELGHGQKGVDGHIAPDATLYYYIEIIDVE